MVTLEQVILRIAAFAPAISREALARAVHAPEPSAKRHQCFSNAQKKAAESGGAALFGWMFVYRRVASIPGPGYLIAIHHAVWHPPDKRLVDVTPFDDDEKHRPLQLNGHVIFLIDRNAVPHCQGGEGIALPSCYFSLTENAAIETHIAQLQATDIAEWEAAMAALKSPAQTS